MLISIIIPTFNRHEQLLTTVKSLLNQNYQNFELVIADDGSTDGTAEVIKTFQKEAWFTVKYQWHENAGRSAARNMGLRVAEGEVVIFIDDHIILDKRFVAEHVHIHSQAKKKQVAFRGRSVLVDDLSEVVTPALLAPLIIDKRRINDPFYTFITNNLSVRRSVIAEVGGFDEDFKNYGFQDSELGYRIRRKCYSFGWVPSAVGYIFSCEHSPEKSWERARQVGISATIFSRKHPESRLKVGLNFLNRLFYFWASKNEGERVNRWQFKYIGRLASEDLIGADRIQYWIKHYYFCKGMYGK